MLTLRNQYFDLIDKMFEEVYSDTRSNNYFSLYQGEDGEQYFEIDLPGVKKEDVKVEIEDRKIYIKAERKGTRSYKYSKTVYIPKNLDTQDPHVKLEDGILYIGFKTMEPDKAPRKLIELK